jgi:uncharacterized protein (DUF952 family)
MRIYKICTRALWDATERSGVFPGMPIDLADGYVHFSTAEQCDETARKYFSGQKGLILLSVDTAALGDALKWEPASSGARAGLFPHLYAPLLLSHIIEATPFDVGE